MRKVNISSKLLLLTCFCALAMTSGIGCATTDEVNVLGEGYGLRTSGGGLPHSPSIVSLVSKEKNGRWEVLWHAISFRCQRPVALEGCVVFGAVTSKKQIERGHVRLLLYSKDFGVVDITDEIAQRSGLRIAPRISFINLESKESSVEIRAEGQHSFSTQVSVRELVSIAKLVAGKNSTETIDGIDFFVSPSNSVPR